MRMEAECRASHPLWSALPPSAVICELKAQIVKTAIEPSSKLNDTDWLITFYAAIECLSSFWQVLTTVFHCQLSASEKTEKPYASR